MLAMVKVGLVNVTQTSWYSNVSNIVSNVDDSVVGSGPTPSYIDK